FLDVAFQLGTLEVGGTRRALDVPAAQHLARVQLAHAQRCGIDALALYFHSSAPRRQTYRNATSSSTMNTIVSASAKLPKARSSIAIGYRKATSRSNRMNSMAIR